jgi:hypothetical protein
MHSRQLNSAHRRGIVVVVAAIFALLMLLLSSGSDATTTPKNQGPQAATSVWPAVEPVPPDTSSPSSTKVEAPPTPKPATSSTQAPLPTPKATAVATLKPTVPILSSKDKEAISILGFWWDTFVIALEKSDGLRFTKEQLRQPRVAIVKKASCKQPATNMLGPKSRTSLTYCGERLDLVPNVFMTITDEGKIKVAASGFLYHAVDVAPASQLKGRSKMELLGYLQAHLSLALVDYQAITHPEASWAVVHPVGSGHPDVNLGYVRGVTELEG